MMTFFLAIHNHSTQIPKVVVETAQDKRLEWVHHSREGAEMEVKDKIGPVTRPVLEDLPKERLVRLHVLTKVAIEASEQKLVEEAGGRIETGVGNLLLVTCEAGVVQRIANLDFVRAVELSEIVLPRVEENAEDTAR